MKIKIKDLVQDDIQQCQTMMQAFYQTDAVNCDIPKYIITNTLNYALTSNPYIRILICLYDGHYAGYCQLSFTYSSEVGGQVVLIEEIYIKDEFQNRGICKALFTEIRKQYDHNTKRYRLEVTQNNIKAISLYQKLGFKELTYQQMIINL